MGRLREVTGEGFTGGDGRRFGTLPEKVTGSLCFLLFLSVSVFLDGKVTGQEVTGEG